MPKRDIEDFISHWKGATASEQSISQQFLLELCDALDVPQPGVQRNGSYTFEFHVKDVQADGSTKEGRIDLYKRDCFILESKKFQEKVTEQTMLELAAEKMGAVAKRGKIAAPVRDTDRWDDAMLKAFIQARDYVRALPTHEPSPPFLLVVDIGHVIEVRADFSKTGRAYQHFPDSLSYRIPLEQLRDEKVRERLKLIWTNPEALDPSKRSAEVTREVAKHLAVLAQSFEKDHPPKIVAEFLTRCLFCMFAEDVGLLPNADGKKGFTELLKSIPTSGEGFETMLRTLFAEMNDGRSKDVSVILRRKLLKFNGGLFADNTVLPVNGTQLGILKSAAALDWQHVEPAIFGTLLERALGGEGERHKLGAHFTPRSYVERLVLPTVIEPLRAEWENVRAAAVQLGKRGEIEKARVEINRFHERLCEVKVLDPACGSGNFLYVALEHLKRLEGEVWDFAGQFGESFKLEMTEHTVDPHQFLGLEINPRGASIAEMVLWIGYLQWHFRTRGQTMPAEPVLKNFKNIQCRDAVLAYDGEPQPVTWEMAAKNPDLPGLPDNVRDQLRSSGRESALTKDRDSQSRLTSAATITVWDRRSMKVDALTGRDVPDETKRVPLLTYAKPRPATWPEADFIVGNPPFIGTARMREDLGDGYAETLRAAYPDVPESADFVLYWWHKAAELVRTGKVRRFGLITTNSLRQTFARRVVQFHLDGRSGGRESALIKDRDSQSRLTSAATKQKLSLAFAIPDHPWVDTADGAAVRIAMTVGVPGEHTGELLEVKTETLQADGSAKVTFDTKRGRISADLTTGADVTGTVELKSNERLAYRGVQLIGSGFIVTPDEAKRLGLGTIRGLEKHIRPYRNGKDLTDEPRGVMAIDLFGLAEKEVREKLPAVFQHVLTTVKPERDSNKRASYRGKWWIHGEPRNDLRPALAGLRRYIATVETSKHRFFQFLDAEVLPDNKLVVITLDNAFYLGVLSSRIHVVYCSPDAAGALLESRPVYVKSRCFDPFPFPLCGEQEKARVRELAEALDAHRKQAQAKHGITLTGLYNVLEKIRAARPTALPHPNPLPLGEGTAASPPGKSTAPDPNPARDTMLPPSEPQGRAGCPQPAGLRRGGDSAPSQPQGSGGQSAKFLSARSLLAEGRGEGERVQESSAPATTLTAKEKLIHDRGLVSTLKSLHDDLDAAVFAAYGWPSNLTDAEILERLVALNAERAEEEKRGVIHWLRPEYQIKAVGGTSYASPALNLPESKPKPEKSGTRGPRPSGKLAWPKSLPERVQAVETALHAAAAPVAPADLAKRFARANPAAVLEILKTLETLGRARRQGNQFTR